MTHTCSPTVFCDRTCQISNSEEAKRHFLVIFIHLKKKAYFIVVRFEFQKENLGSGISLNRWQAVL